jgi:hypothetical protein
LGCDLAATEFVMATRRILVLRSPPPFGEVTFVPAALSGRAEAETVRAMAAAAAEHALPSAADMVRRVRRTLSLGSIGGFAAERSRGIG